jgi:serine palmitoyltransferase
MLLGSIANGLNAGGGFCAGSRNVVEHQRINGTSFVFSAALPAILAVSASEGINILRNTPSILSTLQENIHAIRTILERVDCITIPSHPASPIIHIHLRTPTTLHHHHHHQQQHLSPLLPVPTNSPKSSSLNIVNPASRDAVPAFDITIEEQLLQDIVDEALAQGVWITRARRLRGQEAVEPRPSIRLAVTSALSRKECERAAGIVKAAAVKVLTKRK